MMQNGNLRAFRGDKADKSGVSELMFTDVNNVGPTVVCSAPKIIIYE